MKEQMGCSETVQAKDVVQAEGSPVLESATGACADQQSGLCDNSGRARADVKLHYGKSVRL